MNIFYTFSFNNNNNNTNKQRKKKKLGDTRSWTKDLPDCSRMLYHWAISPVCLRRGPSPPNTCTVKEGTSLPCPWNEKKKVCQEWDLNPCPLTRTRILMITPYQGAKIEPWVWRLRPLGHPDVLLDTELKGIILHWTDLTKTFHPIWGSNPGPLD